MRRTLCKILLVCFVFSSFSLQAMLGARRCFSSLTPLDAILEVEESSLSARLPLLPDSIDSLPSKSGAEGTLFVSSGEGLLCYGLADLHEYMKANSTFRGLVHKDGSDVKYLVEDSTGGYAIRVCCG